ncbi:MAG: DUF72 domain-containing protein [Candidatus Nanopelagicales bacterium]
MPLHIGTCSWNYDSWVGLVYDQPEPRSVDYLAAYAKRYRMVEVDSWFYKIPTIREVEEYAAAVDPGFSFVVKAPQDITLTHKRGGMEPNPAFLSTELFGHFLEGLAPIKGQVGAIILEFEYLNRQKMAGQRAFIDALRAFLDRVPRDIPIALEPRNGPYLDEAWFSFLAESKVSHVFSEKQFMPLIVELYARYSRLLNELVIIRLLGGDRKKIEEASGGRWDKIIDPKPELPRIADMVSDLVASGREVRVDVNNHYEGSAPESIERLKGFLL